MFGVDSRAHARMHTDTDTETEREREREREREEMYGPAINIDMVVVGLRDRTWLGGGGRDQGILIAESPRL